MKILKNDKGEALVLVLFFSLIASLMVVAVLYMVLRGSAISGMQKRYQTSVDAAYAGVSVETRFLKQGSYSINDPMLTSTFTVNPIPGQCLYRKLYFSYNASVANGWTGCTAPEVSMDAKTSPDKTLLVKGQNTTYNVFQKIVDSRRGLTAERPPGVELPTGVAYGSPSGLDLTPQAYFYYAVEVKAVDQKKGEVSRISFDYAW